MQHAIYTELKNIFTSYDSFVVAIKGDWGTGKTYFWNNFKDENLSDKPYAYVSLFGKDSIADIKQDVILKISVKDKHLSTVKDKIKDIKSTFGFKEEELNFGLSGSLIGAAVSLFQKKEFKDVVICIDDFERKSSKLDIKDILGYLSQLKEQFGCKIVLILNESKISEDEKIYKDYKEKIIDFEFSFEPSIEEAFSIVESSMLAFQYEFKKYCEQVALNNIRIMTKVVRFLNRLNENIEISKYSLLTIETLLSKIFSLLTINYKYSFVDIVTLSEYAQSRRFDQEIDKKAFNKEYEEILTYLTNQNILYHIDEIDNLILKFLKKSIFNFDALTSFLAELNEKNNEVLIEQEFHRLQNDILYNLNVDVNQYIEKVYTFLEKNYSIIFIKTSFDNFMFYLKELKTLDKDNCPKYDSLLEKCTKSFVTEILSRDDDLYLHIRDMHHKHIFDAFREVKIASIDEHINSQLATRKQGYNIDALGRVFHAIRKNRVYGDYESDIINSSSISTYKQALFDPVILENIYQFLRDYKNNENFKTGINKVTQAIGQIEEENAGANKYQINRLKLITGIGGEELKKEVENT